MYSIFISALGPIWIWIINIYLKREIYNYLHLQCNITLLPNHYYSCDKKGVHVRSSISKTSASVNEFEKVRGNTENNNHSITVWLLKRAVSFTVLINVLELVTSRTQNIERTVVQDNILNRKFDIK